MTPDEIKQLEVTARKNKGPGNVHPDVYLRAGSVFEFEGVKFAVPPLFPDGATDIRPSFDGDEVHVSIETDTELVDAELVSLAEGLQAALPTAPDDFCDHCGAMVSNGISVDPTRDVQFLSLLFQYARRALGRMYDLTDEQVAGLLAFRSRDLPGWVSDVIAHSVSQPIGGVWHGP